ncbi:MAG: DEAD/DEAH box helicase family protein, partial [Firmicutes bacterium]|nr:DEAD/DEAH box helicase family protein [Bacillota bacterium]
DHGLKKHVSGYRFRESQKKMALAVCDAFNHDEYLLAEAGTGTGKTIAYLMPSVLLSLNSGRPVIISTHTIHLQDQIMRKDIPELNHCFGGSIRSALIKGRNHYLCYRKWENEYEQCEGDNAFFMARLLPWVCATEDGDGDILNLNSFEKKIWQSYSAATENCLGVRCPYYHGKCFVRRARKEAEQAHLIVVNHSLLLTDSVMSGGILPKTDHLIIDEAHQLETVAESCLGMGFSYYDHNSAVNEINGVLQKLYRRVSIPGLNITDQVLEQVHEKQRVIEDCLENIKENGDKARDCFSSLKDVLSGMSGKNVSARTLRIDSHVKNSEYWCDAEVMLENLLVWYEDIRNMLNKISVHFEAELEEDGYENDKIRFTVAKNKWSMNHEALVAFLGGELKNHVAWLEEGNERTLYPILKTAPLLIDNALASSLYNQKESVIFVSATLSVNHNFRYYREVCGIDLTDKKVNELLLQSPFDYDRQAVLLAATDVPLVGSVTEYEYLCRISQTIIS